MAVLMSNFRTSVCDSKMEFSQIWLLVRFYLLCKKIESLVVLEPKLTFFMYFSQEGLLKNKYKIMIMFCKEGSCPEFWGVILRLLNRLLTKKLLNWVGNTYRTIMWTMNGGNIISQRHHLFLSCRTVTAINTYLGKSCSNRPKVFALLNLKICYSILL